jgi:hypothetical protein
MKTTHKILALTVIGAMCALLINHFSGELFSAERNQSNQRFAGVGIPIRTLEDNVGIASEGTKTRELEPHSSSDTGSDGANWSIGKAVHRLKSICENCEATRARLIAEKDVVGARCYYLDVMPPSLEEIEVMRQAISEVLGNVDDSKKQEMDEWVGWMIERYDPFGTSGRKIMGIRIPTDSGKPISGWTYPTADPKNELQLLLKGDMEAPADMQFYVSSDNETSERFSALLVVDGEDDVGRSVAAPIILPRKKTDTEVVVPNGP